MENKPTDNKIVQIDKNSIKLGHEKFKDVDKIFESIQMENFIILSNVDINNII